jgi:hypothetical protein
MSNSKISALTSATTPLAGTETLPIVQSSTTKQVSVANLTAGRSVSVADLTATTGNIVIGTSGKGIDFSATPGTGTSELFADYEEGSVTIGFTASTGTITADASYNTMRYTKIGRQVTLTGNIAVSSVSSPTGALSVTGFPFTSGSGTESRSAVSVLASGLAVGAITQICGLVSNTSTSAAIYKYTAGSIDNLASAVQAGTVFYLTIIYFV